MLGHNSKFSLFVNGRRAVKWFKNLSHVGTNLYANCRMRESFWLNGLKI